MNVFSSTVLRKLLGTKKEQIRGGSSKFLNEKLYNLYCSPNIIRGGHMVRLGENRNFGRKERQHLEYLCVDRRIILKRILKIGSTYIQRIRLAQDRN
jgi:hypothetical protein